MNNTIRLSMSPHCESIEIEGYYCTRRALEPSSLVPLTMRSREMTSRSNAHTRRAAAPRRRAAQALHPASAHP